MKVTDMSVEFLDAMGDDLTVVNAARVSMHKESDFIHDVDEDGFTHYVLGKKDCGLISYLANHDHWSPFAHTSLQFRIKAPIFVARQLAKHQVGGVWNEVSRRYVDDEPEFYLPTVWRGKAENVKQGSSDEEVLVGAAPSNVVETALNAYNYLLSAGVCPEQARMVLPQNMMTEWIWTGSLLFFARVCKQRIDGHAQRETSIIAHLIDSECRELFPVSWAALMGDEV